MLQPTRTKFRKAHKGRIHGNASRCNAMNYGAFGLKAIQPERVISKQIEAARVALTRHMKRQGRVWTRMFPNIPVSKKPIEVRMGKGKGNCRSGIPESSDIVDPAFRKVGKTSRRFSKIVVSPRKKSEM